jgi:hypothetical protein
MNSSDETRRDHERRRLNQQAFRRYFVDCLCVQGCPVCAYTGLVSSAQARQSGDPDPVSPRLPAVGG